MSVVYSFSGTTTTKIIIIIKIISSYLNTLIINIFVIKMRYQKIKINKFVDKNMGFVRTKLMARVTHWQ